jgi:hypothetical protein
MTMITKYYANGFSVVEKVEYDRETSACFYQSGVRVAKVKGAGRHFDTHEEAVAYLIRCAEERIKISLRNVEIDRSHLARIKTRYGAPE